MLSVSSGIWYIFIFNIKAFVATASIILIIKKIAVTVKENRYASSTLYNLETATNNLSSTGNDDIVRSNFNSCELIPLTDKNRMRIP